MGCTWILFTMVKQKYLTFKILDFLTKNGLRQIPNLCNTVANQTLPCDIMEESMELGGSDFNFASISYDIYSQTFF